MLLNPEGLTPPRGYSHVAVANGMLVFIAGQVPTDVDGRTLGVGNFGIQVQQAFANLDVALIAAGSNFGSVAALTIYCAATVSQDDLRGLSKALQSRTGHGRAPAVTLLFVSRLLDPDWLIEVQATAVAGPALVSEGQG